MYSSNIYAFLDYVRKQEKITEFTEFSVTINIAEFVFLLHNGDFYENIDNSNSIFPLRNYLEILKTLF